MPIKTCLGCGNEFPARSTRSKFCNGPCFREKEREGNRARVARYTPERRRAYVLVQMALTKGTLAPQSCEVCGKGHAVAHHDDYAAPLDVRWLWGGDHRRHHHQFGPGLNAFRVELAA